LVTQTLRIWLPIWGVFHSFGLTFANKGYFQLCCCIFVLLCNVRVEYEK
jgi:hypothetical protein